MVTSQANLIQFFRPNFLVLSDLCSFFVGRPRTSRSGAIMRHASGKTTQKEKSRDRRRAPAKQPSCQIKLGQSYISQSRAFCDQSLVNFDQLICCNKENTKQEQNCPHGRSAMHELTNPTVMWHPAVVGKSGQRRNHAARVITATRAGLLQASNSAQ
jgi:hypothetical protein